jgi:hypothetical protein
MTQNMSIIYDIYYGLFMVLSTHLLAPRLRKGWSYTSASPLCLHGCFMGWPLPIIPY